MVFEVKKYSYKIREQMRAPKKIYAIDHGLVQAVRFSFQDNYGRLMENIVYIQLLRQNKDVYYYKDSRECDFVVSDAGKVKVLFQAVKNISDAKTREREIEGLAEAMAQYKLTRGFILTEDDYEELKVREGKIIVMPLWYWLLKNEEG